MPGVPAREEGFTEMPPMYLRYFSTVGPEQLPGRRPAVQHQDVRIADARIVAEPIDDATGTQPIDVRPQLSTVESSFWWEVLRVRALGDMNVSGARLL